MNETATIDVAPTARTTARLLAWIALAGIVVFAVLVIAQGALRNDRSIVRDFVSEYAVGHHGWVQTLAFLAIGIGELALGVGLWMSAGGRRGLRIVAVLVGAGCIVDWASAIFEIDLDEATTTIHGQIHDQAGMVGFILIVAATLIMWRVGRRTSAWRAVGRRSGIVLLLMVIGFVVVGAGDSGGWGGLAQRYVIAVFLTWYAILARELLTQTRSSSPDPRWNGRS